MRDFGFLNRVRGNKGFCQLLALSSWHISHLRCTGERTEYLKYSLVATKHLQNQINNPGEFTKLDTLCTVLMFIITSVSGQSSHIESTT